MTDDRRRSALADIKAAIDREMRAAEYRWSMFWHGPNSSLGRRIPPVEPREAVTPGTQERQSSLDGGTHAKP